jgi:hypothetical protein
MATGPGKLHVHGWAFIANAAVTRIDRFELGLFLSHVGGLRAAQFIGPQAGQSTFPDSGGANDRLRAL